MFDINEVKDWNSFKRLYLSKLNKCKLIVSTPQKKEIHLKYMNEAHMYLVQQCRHFCTCFFSRCYVYSDSSMRVVSLRMILTYLELRIVSFDFALCYIFFKNMWNTCWWWEIVSSKSFMNIVNDLIRKSSSKLIITCIRSQRIREFCRNLFSGKKRQNYVSIF